MVTPKEGGSQFMHVLENEDEISLSGSDVFSIRIHHGGEFLYHPKIRYLGGEVDIMTIWSRDTMKMSAINDFYKGLGYKDYASYFYIFLGSQLETQLVLMSTDEAVMQMVNQMNYNNRVVDVYCKHNEEYQRDRKESEIETVNSDRSSGYNDSAYGDSETDVDNNGNQLFGGKELIDLSGDEEHVDLDGAKEKAKGKDVINERVKAKGDELILSDKWNVSVDGFYAESEPEYEKNDSDDFCSLDGSDFEEDDPRQLMGRKKTPKYKRFNPLTEMDEPKFELGMEFTDHAEFRNDVKSYAVKNGKGVRFVKNERKKVSAKCKDGCPWYIYGSLLGGEKNSFRIRTFVDKHNCSKVMVNKAINSRWIGNKYTDRYKLNPTWPADSFFHTVGKELDLVVSKSSAYRALKIAKHNAGSSVAEQYSSLWDYKEELIRSNPGTTVEIVCEHLNGKPIFQRMYICLGGLKRGFIEGCRKVIGLDGCFLKGPVKGMILSAVGVDANNGMWPLAYAVVEGGNRDSWTWFLELLLVDIGCVNSSHWTFMSDKQKGLVPSLEALVPNAEIRLCVKHLHDNFKLQYRGLVLKKQLYACAKASYSEKFHIEMEKMKQKSVKAYEWLSGKTPKHWSRAFFLTNQCCDMLLNNLCETFNSCIVKARAMAILDMLEWIRIYLMSRLEKCREVMRAYQGLVCPRINKKLDKCKGESHDFITICAGVRKYQVRGIHGDQFDVDLNIQICSCRNWQLSGIPCPHAISAMNHNQLDPEHYVADWYRKDTYMKAYENMVYPLRGRDMWPKTNLELNPPIQKKMPGRPKRRRIKQLDEKKGKPNKLRKHQDTVRCKICGEEYHNARTCPLKPPPQLAPEDQEAEAATTQQLPRKKLPVKKKKGPLLWNRNIVDEEITTDTQPGSIQIPSTQPVSIQRSSTQLVSIQRSSTQPGASKSPAVTKKQAMRGPTGAQNSFSQTYQTRPGQRMAMPEMPYVATTVGGISFPATNNIWMGNRSITLGSLQAAANLRKKKGDQQGEPMKGKEI